MGKSENNIGLGCDGHGSIHSYILYNFIIYYKYIYIYRSGRSYYYILTGEKLVQGCMRGMGQTIPLVPFQKKTSVSDKDWDYNLLYLGCSLSTSL